MVDVPVDTPLVSLIKAGEGNLLVAASTGHGLVIDMKSAMAQTRSGKQVLNLSGNARAVACCVATGDHVAVVGQNRRLLVFKLDEVPEMQRGKGVILQRYKDGDLSDIKVFTLADGLSWQMGGGRTRTETDLLAWQGKRGAAGKLPPNGFPRPARFT
jgi:topoisomerase-4 subunit A